MIPPVIADTGGLLRALASVASTSLANATLFQQMRTITSSLGEGVISLDHHGRVEFVNPAGESLLATLGQWNVAPAAPLTAIPAPRPCAGCARSGR